MAYVYGGGFGDYNGFDGLFSKIKSAVRSTVKGVGSAVSVVTKQIDPTYSKSLIGKIPVVGKPVVSLARQGAASAAAVQTMGLSIFAGQKGVISKSTFGVKPAMQAAATGAAVGSAVGAGKGLTATAASTLKSAAPVATPAVSVPVVAEAPVDMAATAQPPARGGAIGPLAGAGAGFLAAGPVGAVVGAAAGYFLTKPKGG